MTGVLRAGAGVLPALDEGVALQAGWAGADALVAPAHALRADAALGALAGVELAADVGVALVVGRAGADLGEKWYT